MREYGQLEIDKTKLKTSILKAHFTSIKMDKMKKRTETKK